MSFGFVFPGQGSQSVGMLASARRGRRRCRSSGPLSMRRPLYLGYDLWRLVQEGPEDQLSSTERQQPAMLTAGVATWRLWCGRGGALPSVVSGHSLGEFTALVCAGALEFRTAVDLVRFRGQAMQEAVPLGTGAVAAILGLEEASLEEACREAAQGEIVALANFNAPGQIVIAGHTAAVQRAIEGAKARGAKRAMLLPVSVPVHTTLMRGAADRLAGKLRSVEIRKPQIRVHQRGGCGSSPGARRPSRAPGTTAAEPRPLAGYGAGPFGDGHRAAGRMWSRQSAHGFEPPDREATGAGVSGAGGSGFGRGRPGGRSRGSECSITMWRS